MHPRLYVFPLPCSQAEVSHDMGMMMMVYTLMTIKFSGSQTPTLTPAGSFSVQFSEHFLSQFVSCLYHLHYPSHLHHSHSLLHLVHLVRSLASQHRRAPRMVWHNCNRTIVHLTLLDPRCGNTEPLKVQHS